MSDTSISIPGNVASREMLEAAMKSIEILTYERDQLIQKNTALRAALEESEEFARKNGETCGLKIRDLLHENAALRGEIRQHEEQIEFLIGENAKLQGELERWMNSSKWLSESKGFMRELEARKEAQP